MIADLVFLLEAPAVLPPGPEAAEIADAVESVEESAGRRRRFSRRLTAAQRLAIEQRAVRVATEYLERDGYTVVDVGATHSYDLDARRGEERLFVEVKGTTSAGVEVVLTKAEVELHEREYPNTMLAIVAGIDLKSEDATAFGGSLRVIHPWRIERERLDPLAFRYAVPR